MSNGQHMICKVPKPPPEMRGNPFQDFRYTHSVILRGMELCQLTPFNF